MHLNTHWKLNIGNIMQTFEILVFPEIKIKFESCKRNVLKEVHLTNYQPCTNIVFENLKIFKLNVPDFEGIISFIKT